MNVFKSVKVSVPNNNTTWTNVVTGAAGKITIAFSGTICNTTTSSIVKLSLKAGETYILHNTPLAFGATCVLSKMVIEEADTLDILCTGGTADICLSVLEQDKVAEPTPSFIE